MPELAPELTPELTVSASNATPQLNLAAEIKAALVELQTGDFHQRWDAAKRLSEFGNQAVAPLLQLIDQADPDCDDDWELLWFVARILGSFQDPSAVAGLVKLLESAPDSEVATMAAMALANAGAAALPALAQLLQRPSSQLTALQALAQIQHPAVLPLLQEAAASGSAAVRVAAVAALAQLQVTGSADLWPLFVASLSDSAAAVRRAAVMALGARALQFSAQVSAAALVEEIAPLLKDPDLAVRQQVALALGRVGGDAAIAALGQALSEPSSHNLQVELLHALAWTEQPAALAQIRQYLQSHQDQPTGLEPEIVAVLGRVTLSAIASQILLELLASAHPIAQTVAGKQQIALSLGQLQQVAAIDPLIELLADPTVSVRLHAAAALKQLAAQGAFGQMQQRLGDPNSSAALRLGLLSALEAQPLSLA